MSCFGWSKKKKNLIEQENILDSAIRAGIKPEKVLDIMEDVDKETKHKHISVSYTHLTLPTTPYV